MLRIVGCIVGLLAALPAAAMAAPHTVTDYTDAPRAGLAAPPGSLRQVLDEAEPGDTIGFDRAGVVQLNFRLAVPSRLRGVTIDGAVAGGRAGIRLATGGANAIALDVSAAGATVANLVFTDAALGVSGAGGSVDDVRVQNNTFIGAASVLKVSRGSGTVIRGNSFEGAQDRALSLDRSAGDDIRGNRFANAGGLAIAGEGIHRTRIADNDLEGAGVALEGGGLRVRDNRFTSGTLPALVIRGNGEGADATIADNTFVLAGSQAIRLISDRASTIRHNTITSASGRGRLALQCFGNASAPAVDVVGNTLAGAQIAAGCPRAIRWELRRNTITGSRLYGIFVEADRGRVTIDGGALAGNGGGVLVSGRTRTRITRVRIAANAGAGVLVRSGAPVDISGVAMGANGGPGIDRPPAGLSPNAAPGAPVLRYDRRKARITGKTCPRCRVELYASEPDPQLGNPGHGEGTQLLRTITADGDGRFAVPRRGSFDCPASGRVTATATRKAGEATSEFARDVECSCVVHGEFEIDPASVPEFGFSNFGIAIAFPEGATPGAATLTDVATEERPADDAFAPLTWEEFVHKPGRPPDEGFSEEFFVQVRRGPGTPQSTRETVTWAYDVAYEPPPGAKGCSAKLT